MAVFQKDRVLLPGNRSCLGAPSSHERPKRLELVEEPLRAIARPRGPQHVRQPVQDRGRPRTRCRGADEREWALLVEEAARKKPRRGRSKRPLRGADRAVFDMPRSDERSAARARSITFGAPWEHFGRTLGAHLTHPGSTFGAPWEHFGRTLGALWAHPGSTFCATPARRPVPQLRYGSSRRVANHAASPSAVKASPKLILTSRRLILTSHRSRCDSA